MCPTDDDRHTRQLPPGTYVQKYGLRLLPDLFEGFNPLSYKAAVEAEIEIGIDLRSAGFGVWQT